jgi:hypothetical protein
MAIFPNILRPRLHIVSSFDLTSHQLFTYLGRTLFSALLVSSSRGQPAQNPNPFALS